MAKPLQVDNIWLERIAGMLNDMEFGSLNIIVHEGQIVQVERTERKRYEMANSSNIKPANRPRNSLKPLRESGSR